jgi:hypothetical protein
MTIGLVTVAILMALVAVQARAKGNRYALLVGVKYDDNPVPTGYACRHIEETPERMMPCYGDDSRKRYGLFANALVELLKNSEGRMTYTNLIERLNRQCSNLNRNRRSLWWRAAGVTARAGRGSQPRSNPDHHQGQGRHYQRWQARRSERRQRAGSAPAKMAMIPTRASGSSR